MTLEVRHFPVREVVIGEQTRYQDGILEVDGGAVRELAARQDALRGVDIEIAHPGEAARIINLLDTVPAICKAKGGGSSYPGFLGPAATAGTGITHQLTGVAIMQCAQLPRDAGGLLMPREALVDMAGPGAPLTPFGDTINIVLRFELAPGRDEMEYDAAIRLTGLRVADLLARATAGLTPPDRTIYALDGQEAAGRDLPRIAYIHQIQAQGNHANTFVYGRSFIDNLPTLVHPNELLDGAVVSGNYVYGAFKTPTYMHCYSPTLQALFPGHGVDHQLLPVILSRGHNYSIAEKVRSAQYAAKLAQLLRADGVVISWEGGGNSVTDAMQTVKACEEAGIKTAVIAYEMAAEQGETVNMLDSVPEADAIVSAGSPEQQVLLPRMERVLGGPYLRMSGEAGEEQVDATGPLHLPSLHQIYGGANQVGFGTLTCRPY